MTDIAYLRLHFVTDYYDTLLHIGCIHQSDVPTIVFGIDPVASPVRHEPSGGCAVGKAIKWYAIRKSIHGRSLIVNHWMDCEPHVKVWNVGKTEKIIPYGVQYKSFDTFEEAAIFLFE